MSRIEPQLGILVPLTSDALAATGAGTRDSVYTEAGPGPGRAEGLERWRPVVTGDQTVGVDVRAIRGGYPARGSGVQVLVRLDTDTADTDWRSWQEPVLLTGFYAPTEYQALSAVAATACAVRSDTGEVVCLASDGGTDARTFAFNPRTETFVSGMDWGAAQGLPSPAAMAEDPSVPGRILLWAGTPTISSYDESLVAYYSDDSGVSWSVYAIGWMDGVAEGLSHVATHPTEDWIGITPTRAVYSPDHGVTWRPAGSVYSSLIYAGSTPTVARGPRGYVVAYPKVTTGFPCVRVLPTAQSDFAEATEIEVDAGGPVCNRLVVVPDSDGAMYVFGFQESGVSNATEGLVSVWRSDDGGYTWTGYGPRGLLGNGTSFTDQTGVEHASGVASGGSIFLLGTADAGLSGDAGAFILRCGGWSNVDHGSQVAEGVGRSWKAGWPEGSPPGSNGGGVVYVPTDFPIDHQWNATGAGGSYTLDAGGLVVTTSAGQRKTFDVVLSSGAAEDYASGEAIVQVVSGRIYSQSETFVSHVLLDSATTGYELRIYLGTDGWLVLDAGGLNIRASGAADTTTARVHFRWMIRRSGGVGYATVWKRHLGTEKWTRIANDVVLTSAAHTDNRIRYDQDTVGVAAVNRVFMLAAANSFDWRYGLDDAADLALTPADGVRGIFASRPLPPVGGRIEVPLLGSSGDAPGYLHGLGGPAYLGDECTIPVGYRWPVEAVSPAEVPSPSRPWRATGTAEVRLVYDATVARWRGGALALVAERASFRTAVLEVDDGGAGWTTIGTLDKGAAVDYGLAGLTAYPSGSGTLARYVAENELAGGYLVVPTGGGSPDQAIRIVGNSAGYWSASAGQKVRIELDPAGLTGSEDASGTGELVWPSGVLVAYPSSETPRRYLRIRVPSGQVVPSDRGTDGTTAAYDAGVLFAARVASIGTEPDWGTQRTISIPAQVSRRADGSPSMSRTGRARVAWSYSWGASAAGLMRTLDAGADHLGASGGNAIGTYQDAWSALPALVDALDGGPLVLVSRLPWTDTTITDHTRWVYGLATAPDLTLRHEDGGWEGIDEFAAVGTLTVEEIP